MNRDTFFDMNGNETEPPPRADPSRPTSPDGRMYSDTEQYARYVAVVDLRDRSAAILQAADTMTLDRKAAIAELTQLATHSALSHCRTEGDLAWALDGLKRCLAGELGVLQMSRYLRCLRVRVGELRLVVSAAAHDCPRPPGPNAGRPIKGRPLGTGARMAAY